VTLSVFSPPRPVQLRPAGGPPLVLIAHGSRDPRSASTMRRLASRVRASWAGPVSAAFLDFNLPGVPSVLRGLAPGASAPSVVVPCLLTSAHHGRVDVPQVLADAGVPTRLTPVLGPATPADEPDPRLVAALRRRLSELDASFDALVLIAAGTSYAAARSTVDAVAGSLGRALDMPCLVGYASASAPTPAEAVAELRRRGASRIAAASYFLAPGRLYDVAATSARAAGAVAVAGPLGPADEIVRLILARAQAPAQDLVDHEVNVMIDAVW
jgi:sirohydrochlorin ferrochelatase